MIADDDSAGVAPESTAANNPRMSTPGSAATAPTAIADQSTPGGGEALNGGALCGGLYGESLIVGA